MSRYVALIDGKAEAYGVVVPDLPGCTAMGRTVETALSHAVAAMRDWVEVTEAAQAPVPPPRSVEALRQDEEVIAALADGALLAIVPLIRHTGQSTKANLSLDSGILASIDQAAHARGLSRSAFVELMAEEQIGRGL